MASQIGKTRLYTDPSEDTSPKKVKCDKCQVLAVPRGLTSTRISHQAGTEKHCPNCGHVHRAGAGRDNH